MGALDVKFGEILQQGRNLAEAVGDLKESSKLDHDVLILLKNTIEEDRKTFYNRIGKVEDDFRKGEELRDQRIKLFIEAQQKKEDAAALEKKAADDKKAERHEKSAESKRKVVYTMLLKILSWGLVMLGAYLSAKFGISSHGK